MKTYMILTGLLAMTVTTIAAQEKNLVNNGSFEVTEGKVKGRAEYDRAAGISSSNNTTIDLYSREAAGEDFDVPNNYMGTQESKTGNNYVGIIAYYGQERGIFKTKPAYQEYTEYIQFDLAEPLEAGKAYNVTFNISLADRSAYAVTGMGVYFTTDKLDEKDNAYLDVTPHIVATTLLDSKEWSEFSGTYVAQGGERYMTLGCFDEYMITMKVIPENTNNSRKAYYFIDDVGVSPSIIPTDDLTMILSGSCYQLNDLNFETDKAVILPESYNELDALASFLQKYPFIMVYIDGHTDKTGTDTYNHQLSHDRAAAVRTYLTGKGVADTRMKTRGFGETQPIDKENEDSFVNRRVEITICGDRLTVIK